MLQRLCPKGVGLQSLQKEMQRAVLDHRSCPIGRSAMFWQSGSSSWYVPCLARGNRHHANAVYRDRALRKPVRLPKFCLYLARAQLADLAFLRPRSLQSLVYDRYLLLSSPLLSMQNTQHPSHRNASPRSALSSSRSTIFAISL